jgi:lysophospholipase L1-like esterase
LLIPATARIGIRRIEIEHVGNPLTVLFHRIAFWLLLPIAAFQGLALRKTAMRLPPPPGMTQGVFGQTAQNRFGKAFRLLALGDSIIAGIGASEQELSLPAQLARALAQIKGQAVSWYSQGRNGANSTDLLGLLDELQNQPPPDLVLISIGVNDVTGLSSSKTWQANINTLCEKLGARWPAAVIVFAGLPPMDKFPLPPQPLRFCLGLRASYFDHIAAYSIEPHTGMLHIPTMIDPSEHDFCADGFHPSDQAYAVWGEEMAEIITNLYPAMTRRKAS